MLFRETVAVYCENHREHTNTLRGQNAGFLCVKACVIHSYQYSLEGESIYRCLKYHLQNIKIIIK
jgi:hypothetical protein